MASLHSRHNASVDVQQELRAIWEAVDLLRKRESRLRRAVEGGSGGPPGGTAGAGSGYQVVETPTGGPLLHAAGDSLTFAAAGPLTIVGDAVTDTVTFTNTGPSKGFVIAMAAAL